MRPLSAAEKAKVQRLADEREAKARARQKALAAKQALQKALDESRAELERRQRGADELDDTCERPEPPGRLPLPAPPAGAPDLAAELANELMISWSFAVGFSSATLLNLYPFTPEEFW